MKDEQIKLIDDAIDTVERLMVTFDVLDTEQLSTLQRVERVREMLLSIKRGPRVVNVTDINPMP